MKNLIITAILLASTISHAAVVTVKQDGTGDFTHIQQAINAAAVNDTVLVWPGTYYENLSFYGKDLTLASLYLTTGKREYIAQTIIDGNKNGNVITLQDGETLATMICGFTIQNGKKDFSNFSWMKEGSGILIRQGSANISNNIIKGNRAFAGAGLSVVNGTARLFGNHITDNAAYYRGGGIFYNNQEHPVYFDTIELNTVYLNYAYTGSDLLIISTGQPQVIELDTMTVFNPDIYFALCIDGFSNPVNDLTLNIRHQKIEPVAADLYVSPQGNNNNSGLDPEHPLLSINFAMTKIQPDSLVQRTIHILPGTYSPQTTGERFPIGGRSNIKLSGENMYSTIIDCNYDGYFFSSFHMDIIEIENLTFIRGVGPSQSPIAVYSGCISPFHARKIIISNIKIENILYAFSQCVSCYQPDSVYIKNFDCMNSIGVQANHFSRHMDDFPMYVRIENAKIHGNTYYDEGTFLYGGYKNLIVSGGDLNNKICTGKLINVEITDNISWDTWYSITCGPGWATSKKVKLYIVNATIGGNRDRMNLPGTNSTVKGSQVNIYNSIFYDNNSPDIYIYWANETKPAEINFHYTLFENGAAGIIDSAGNTIVNWGEGILDQDPQWQGYGANPYALTINSPCINAGTPMYEPGMSPPYIKEENERYILYTPNMDTIHLPATDLIGNPRIAYGRIDMGAYEFADITINIPSPAKLIGGEIKVFPNPFQSSTNLQFTLLKGGQCEALIYDLNGRKVKTLMNAFTPPGNYRMRWHGDSDYGNDAPPGIYIIAIQIDGQQAGSVKVERR